jgi:Kip1 ubiquitination-promoting complex protein 1
VTIRADTGVFDGEYYFEVNLKTDGLMQIGFCTLQTPFTTSRGVGDDPTSYAFDGHRVKIWNNQSKSYGEAWSAGDTIGASIDFQSKSISFYRNFKKFDKAFIRVPTG